MSALLQQLQQYLGHRRGAVLVLLLQLIFAFIMKHWKALLIISAAVAALSLAVLAARGGF